MDLQTILKFHDRYSKGTALKENLGDGFLIAKNPIYRDLRKKILKSGFKIKSTRFHDYDALSLTQLPRILKHKIIPYCNNVRALREIEQALPGNFWWAEVPPLRSNYIMHESAHGVAFAARQKFFKNKKPKNEREMILQTLFEESYANASECVANVYSDTEIHEEFLHKNFYIVEKFRDRVILKRAIKAVGLKSTLKLMMLAYLHSNFQKTRVSDSELRRVLLMLKLKNSSVLKKAFQIGLRLDPAFTMFTNAFCFRLMGVKGNLSEVLDFDFVGAFEKDARFLKWMDAIV